MLELPENYSNAVKYLAETLTDINYCFRGTVSLVLQGFDMNVDDIDILSDKDNALKFNDLLKEHITSKVEYKDSEKFKSYYGKFVINDVPGEVYGDWQIKDTKGVWSRVYSSHERISLNYLGVILYVTPVDLELECFAKMGRWAAFQKIKGIYNKMNKVEDTKQIKSPQLTLFK